MAKVDNHLNILFLILDVALTIENSTVFQSQVVDQMIALRKCGYKVAVLCAFKNLAKFQLVAGSKLEKHQVLIHLVPDLGLIKNILSFAIALKRLSRSHQIKRIYIRGFWAALPIHLVSPMNPSNYIYDVRGDIIDESSARARSRYRHFLIRILETFALRRALYVTCVTRQLSAIVMNRARLDALPEVIPSCINLSDFSFNEESRAAQRASLGYSNKDIVLVYSGGTANYQMIPEMLELWRGLLPLNSHTKFLLMINSDRQSLERSLGSLDDFGSRIKILNLARSEVFVTLSASDIGFLLREDRVLNACASPVKFAEYLVAGLAVVSSPCVGDISDLIVNRQIGVLVDPKNVQCGIDRVQIYLQKFMLNRLSYRLSSLNLAEERYNWRSYQKLYDVLYGQPIK